MNEPENRSPGRFMGRASIALLQGGLLWWLYRAVEQETWPATDRGWLIGLIAATILVPIAHYLMADVAIDRRRDWLLLPLALAVFGLGWHHGAWTIDDLHFQSVAFALALAVLVFHALPFAQVWLAQRRWRPQYEELFHYAWRNTLLLAFGGVFCGVFWLLLWLWGALFRMLGVDFFRDLFTEPYFAIPATTVAVGIGLQLAGSVERLQNVLRNQLLTMLKWLAPLAMAILAMFTLTLLLKSPELLLEQRRVISATWLLWLVALAVALLNTAYQDGRSAAPYPAWLGKAIRLVVPLLLPVSVLALYAIGVRVDSYGLTVARGWGLLVAVIALAYSLGYAWAALGKDAWMGRMGVVNVYVALATVVLLTLMLSPVLSPERLAAASQFTRVLEQQDEDSYRYLRFDSGAYGRARLRRLAELQDHPQAESIRAAAKRELKRKFPWYQRGPKETLTADDFEVFPASQALEPGLLAALGATERNDVLHSCEPPEPCPMLFVDLNRDGEDEALVFSNFGTVALRRKGGTWAAARRLDTFRAAASFHDRRSIRAALRDGSYAVRDLEWQVLDVRGERFVFDDPERQPESSGVPGPE
ncbi:MAG: DUF4153 domain-containing protein [Steroidobacteraceae bacterium]